MPSYECLEVMDEGEFVEADDSSLGGGGEARYHPLQLAAALRERPSTPFMYRSCMGRSAGRSLRSRWLRCRTSPSRRRTRGVLARSLRKMDDGKTFYRVTEAALPTLRVVPNPRVAQFARVGSSRLGPADRQIHLFASMSPAGSSRQATSATCVQKFNGKDWGNERGGAPAPIRAITKRRSGKDRSRFTRKSISRSRIGVF